MIDLGLTDKILVRDQLIRILKQESFREIVQGSMDDGLVDRSRDAGRKILWNTKKHNQRHHAVVIQQPQPSSSEASVDSSASSVSWRSVDGRPQTPETDRRPDRQPESNTTPPEQEYEQENNGEWKKGLCECCDPGCKCRRCCITCCLWPMTISRNAEAVGLSNSYIWPWMLTFSIGLCFCTSCLTRAVLRTQIRQKYGIPGSHCNGKN